MQPGQSTSAPGLGAQPTSNEQRTTEHIQTTLSALELWISEHVQTSNTALLAELQRLTCSNAPTNRQQSIPPYATIAIEGGKAAQEPPIDMLNDDSKLLELEFVGFSAYVKVINAGLECPPRDIDEPRLWTLTDDTARFLDNMRFQAGYDEYLHIGCYAFFES
jgi:hypothetical protein